MKLELTDEQVVVILDALVEYIERHGDDIVGEKVRPLANKIISASLAETNEVEHYRDKCKFCGDLMAPGRGDFCTRICRADYGRPVR